MLTSGRKKSVQDAPTANDHDCTDAKPTKRSFKGKGDGVKQGIVRFWKGWCGAKGGGEAIPPVVARIFSGDSTSPLTREASVIVQSKG